MTRLPQEIEDLLKAWSEGKKEALGQLMPLVCDDLRTMAQRYMRQEQGVTLQPTALVNEVFLKFLNIRQTTWKNAKHFFGFAAMTMRRILVDHARGRQALKRGEGTATVPIGDLVLGAELPADIIALNDALSDLARLEPRQARVVDLRYIVGLTVEEAAAVLGISVATVKRDWDNARLWLQREVRGQ